MADVFRDQLHVIDHMKVLQQVVLMHQSDIYFSFSHFLLTEMQRNPVGWANTERLNAFYQSEVHRIYESNSNGDVAVEHQHELAANVNLRIRVNDLPPATVSRHIDVSSLKCVYFAFSASQPLHVLFTQNTMRKYSTLAVLLLQVKAVDSSITTVFSIWITLTMKGYLTGICCVV